MRRYCLHNAKCAEACPSSNIHNLLHHDAAHIREEACVPEQVLDASSIAEGCTLTAYHHEWTVHMMGRMVLDIPSV